MWTNSITDTPQFYPECAQLQLSSNGDAVPPATYLKSIPAYAPQSDPGVTVCTRTLDQLNHNALPHTSQFLGRYVYVQGYKVHMSWRSCLGWL